MYVSNVTGHSLGAAALVGMMSSAMAAIQAPGWGFRALIVKGISSETDLKKII